MFLHRLALAFDVMDVDALSATVPVRVVRQWMAFWRVEPFGDEWRRTGKLAAVVAAAMGGEIPADFEDTFLPSYRAPVQTKEQMLEQLRKIPAFAAQMEAKGL